MFQEQMNDIKAYWSGLGARDQKALFVGGIVLLVTLAFFVIFIPVANKKQALETELSNAQQVYNELIVLAPNALAKKGNPTSVNASSMNTAIRKQAARYGLEIQRFEPDSNNLKVWLEDMPYSSTIQWLSALETLGITHSELSLVNRSSLGLVSTRVTFMFKGEE